MIDKYYNGVIEQVVSGIGNVEHNSILVRYSNDFSIWDLESVNHYKMCIRDRELQQRICHTFLIVSTGRTLREIPHPVAVESDCRL